jgi:3-deoxy-manno-octulosonate cytidylyltransferase (CMP-KDO synthetase)
MVPGPARLERDVNSGLSRLEPPRKVAAIIPARYASSRFPGKALADIQGSAMICRVYQRASMARLVNEVFVATDDERIKKKVEESSGKAILTKTDHLSGTDRLVEAMSHTDADLIVNVQGDEPVIHPEMIDQAIEPFFTEPTLVMATLKKRIDSRQELSDTNVVKVVCDHKGDALYFSRLPIPFFREGDAKHYKHIGLYVYRREFLESFNKLKPGVLERAECLEQLRVLENGYPIRVIETTRHTIGVDTPEDLEKVRRWLLRNT